MLSEKEKEYLQSQADFIDKYGLDYARVVRNRIRKRLKSAIDDLIDIIRNDKAGGSPVREMRMRRDDKLLHKYYNDQLSEEEIQHIGTYVALSNLNVMLSSRSNVKKEKSMFEITELEIVLVEAIKQSNNPEQTLQFFKNVADSALLEMSVDAKENLIKLYKTVNNPEYWKKYPGVKNDPDYYFKQFASILDLHYGGFKNADEALKWAKNSEGFNICKQ